MRCFEILGISKTRDVKIIKKAYARKIREYEPSEHPEMYQKIREAFEIAMDYCENREVQDKNRKDIFIEREEDNKLGIEAINSNINYDILEVGIEEVEDNRIEKFKDSLQSLYNDPKTRFKIEAWENLLVDTIDWSVEEYKLLEEEIIEFLLSHKYLPCDVIRCLNAYFKWDESELNLYSKYEDKKVKYLLNRVGKKDLVSYEYLENIPSEMIDRYIALKEEICFLKDQPESQKVKEYMMEAYEYEKQDPEVLYFMGRYYTHNDYYEEGLSYFLKAIEINPQYIECYGYISQLLIRLNRATEAISYSEYYYSQRPDDIEAVYRLMEVYYANQQYMQAKKYAVKLLGMRISLRTEVDANRVIKGSEKGIKGRKVKCLKLGTYAQLRKKQRSSLRAFCSILFNIITGIILIIIIPVMLVKGLLQHLIGRADKTIISAEELLQTTNSQSIRIELKDMGTTDYYVLKHPKNTKHIQKYILDEETIDKKQLWGEVLGRLNQSTFENTIVIFWDSNKRDKGKRLKAFQIEETLYKKIVGRDNDQENEIILNRIFINQK